MKSGTIGRRRNPGRGYSSWSRELLRLSVAFPAAHMEAITAEAGVRGVAAGQIVREAVALWMKARADVSAGNAATAETW